MVVPLDPPEQGVVGRSDLVVGTVMDRAGRERFGQRAHFDTLEVGASVGGQVHVTARSHAHHIVHWADGGPTDLDNLALLCGAHHRALHADGWTITRTGPNRYAFHAPNSDRPHPNRLPAVGGGRSDSAEAAARHDPRGLEPPGTVYPDYDLDLTIAILQEALDRLPVAPAA